MGPFPQGQVRGTELSDGLTLVRPLDCRHIDAVRAVAATSFDTVWGPNDYAYFLAHSGRVCLGWFVPDADGKETLVAYFLGLLVHGDLDVISIATRPDFRRQGLGELLLLAGTRAPGVRRTLLEVAVDNTAALCLYEKLSFRVVGRRPGYYEQKRDALVLVREAHSEKRPVPAERVVERSVESRFN